MRNALYQQNNYPMVGTRALDVGAGIGRITRQVLVNIFQQVDFQDQNSTFISQGLGEMSSLVEAGRVRQGIVHPLQTLTPPNKEYDCIWIQWVIGYLPKEELIATLNRLRPSLRKNGYLIIKENCDDELYHDDGDNYLIRKVDDWVNIFNESDFQVISHEEDRLLPKTIKPVFFFLLKPKDEFKAEDMRGPLLPKRRRKAL
ncbi:putative Alpha N-terminal protein methyltransferase 1 [Blattamonas nauphoetae]|uniref:Alpha N-terminal protein methyltransferase 1 n=1 Tax=Blattamonas nauphoetae TaxID=2049346 RepID=A0ABQ9YCE8_9EUKA|nr:putative Alpha N-terminal protein methyltransferase 1 [Blattamonas nauphoetae]